MYKEIAIDPSCMSDFNYYALIKREFGFERGRYAAADVKQWAKEAYHYLKQSTMQPIKRKSVATFLNQVQRGKQKDAFVLTDLRKGAEAEDWLTWWDIQARRRSFSLTVTEKEIESSVAYDAIVDGCDGWEVPPSISITRNAESIVQALEPLLYLSKEILIVDPYFRLSSNDTLKALFQSPSFASINKVVVVSTVTNADYGRVYQRDYQALNHNGTVLEWIIAPDKYFHDRYLITDVGALKAGQGFMPDVEKGTHADKVNINLVSLNEVQGVRDSLSQAMNDGVATIVFAAS